MASTRRSGLISRFRLNQARPIETWPAYLRGMKFLLLCLLLSPLSVFAQQHKPALRSASLKALQASVDKYFGFRDVSLETDIAEHPEMKAIVGADSVTSDPDKTYYF